MIFSAHEHKSVSIKMNKFFNGQKTVTPITKNDKKVKRYRIGSDVIHEFIVPTCSYRMGVEHSGFGAAVISENYYFYIYKNLIYPSFNLICRWIWVLLRLCSLVVSIKISSVTILFLFYLLSNYMDFDKFIISLLWTITKN